MRFFLFSQYFLCVMAGFFSVAFAGGLPGSISQALKQSGLPKSALGVYVQEVGSDKPFISVNENEVFSPASTIKLVTTYAALELLGPHFTWKTRAYAKGPQVGDALQGDLVIKGSGDPKLVAENFWLFLRQIRARGIREIRGNVVLDRSAFEETLFDPAKFDGEASKPYNVGADALLLNYAALRFRFIPIPSLNTVAVAVDPPIANYVVSAPKLTHDECGDWQVKLGAASRATGMNFNGAYAASCGEKTWYLAPHQMRPTAFFGAVFRQMWTDLGGDLKGEVLSGTTPPDAALLAEWESPTLLETVRDVNKYSNNVMARQIFLTLASQAQSLGNTKQSAQIVHKWLTEKGIEASSLVIENGSGLSRNDRISPSVMGRLLIAAFKSPLMPEFISSLPLAGVDGTMRHRLRDQGVVGQAHIKTGRLDGVRSIAGYVRAASGKYYVVASFINHPKIDGNEVSDALLQWIYEHG